MSVWRNSKKWIGHPDHFTDHPDSQCYAEKFNLEVWNHWRVEFYKDEPIDIPKEWYEAFNIIYGKSEKELEEKIKNCGWDTKWYWLYHNPNKKI